MLYSCETLTGELGRRLNSFDTMSLRPFPYYRWQDCMSNDPVLSEAWLRQVTCMFLSANYVSMGMRRDYLQRIPPTEFFSVDN